MRCVLRHGIEGRPDLPSVACGKPATHFVITLANSEWPACREHAELAVNKGMEVRQTDPGETSRC
jgi:hypothetical protein